MTTFLSLARHLLLPVTCGLLAVGVARTQAWVFEHTPLSSVPGLVQASSLVIHGSARDAKGLVWLATNNGILRFDGATYSPFAQALADQVIPYMLEDVRMQVSPQGDIWIVSTERGLLRVSREGSLVSRYQLDDSVHRRIQYGDLFFVQDTVAFVTTSDWKIHRLMIPDGTWTSFDAPRPDTWEGNDLSFGKMVRDSDQEDILWIGSRYGLVGFDMRLGQCTLYSLRDPYRYFIHFREWLLPIHQFDRMIVLAGPYSVGMDVFDPSTRTWEPRVSLDSLEDPYYVSPLLLVPASDSLLLVGLQSYDGMGYFRLRADGTFSYKASFFETELGTLHHMLGYCIEPDQALFGITSYGITRISQPVTDFKFFRLTAEGDFRNNWQRSFLQLDEPNTFALGTYRGDGLIVVDWQKKTSHAIPYQAKEGLYNYDVAMWSLARDHRGMVWIGTDQGLLVADLERERIWQPAAVRAHPALSECDIHFVYYDAPYLWISATNLGLFELNIETDEIRQLDVNPVSVSAVLPRGKHWWICTDKGVRIWDTHFRQWTQDPVQMQGNAVTDLCTVGDSVWVATAEQGLWCMIPDTGDLWNARQYVNHEAYISNLLHQIVYVGEQNELWMNTHFGYTSFNLLTHHFTNYTMDDGIGFMKKNQSIFTRLHDGAVINGAHRHFQYFYPDSVRKSVAIPVPYIDHIASGDTIVTFPTEKNLVFDAGSKNIAITVGGINFNRSPVNYYSFRFGSTDAPWSAWTTNRVISYENLQGGTYEFAFRVANKLFEHGDMTTVGIEIRKKFTETLLFKVLAIAGMGVLIYIPFSFRSRQQRRESKIRTEYQQRINALQMSALRMQMNPHFVFNSINSINYYIIQNDKDKASAYLAKFSRLIRLILESSKEEFTTLEQEIEAITLYLEIERMRFEEKFHYEIEIDDTLQLSTVRIPPLIVQPYVENAIWHGFMPRKGQGHLTVSFRDSKGKLLCIVEDDGIGREAAALLNAGKGMKKESLGTRITKERLDFIQEKYGIQADVSTIDLFNMNGSPAGTRVTVTIPKLSVVVS